MEFILSKRTLLNFKPKICLSWFIFSTSTVTIFFVLIAFLTNSLRLFDVLMWLSLIRISSLKLYLWLWPPPFLTAYFSSVLKLGVVFLVQQILVFLLIFFTNWLVIVAIPEASLRKFKAVLSAVKIVFVLAFILAITLFFFIFFPSETFFVKMLSLPINLKAVLQNSKPAITPSCLAIILAWIILSFVLKMFVVISPLGFRSSSRAFLTTDLI